MLRNHSRSSLVAFLLIGFAIGLAVIAYVMSAKGERGIRYEKLGLGVAGLMFGVGLLLVIWAAVETPSAHERPRITASFSTQSPFTLQVSVKAQGIKADTTMGVTVEGLRRNAAGEFELVNDLYTSSAGPDGSGAVDFSFAVPVPTGSYQFLRIAAAEGVSSFPKCDPNNRAEGCTVIQVPQNASHPTLDVQWSDSQTLQVDVAAVDLSVFRKVVLEITGTGPRGSTKTLYEGALPPDANGALATKITLPVSSSYRSICVAAASLFPDPDSLPPQPPTCDATSIATTWVRTVVPAHVVGTGGAQARSGDAHGHKHARSSGP